MSCIAVAESPLYVSKPSVQHQVVAMWERRRVSTYKKALNWQSRWQVYAAACRLAGAMAYPVVTKQTLGFTTEAECRNIARLHRGCCAAVADSSLRNELALGGGKGHGMRRKTCWMRMNGVGLGTGLYAGQMCSIPDWAGKPNNALP